MIGAFLFGTTCKSLVHKLGCKGPQTTKELLNITTSHNYGAPRVRAYDEQEDEESLKDAMDQLDEARGVALLRSANYQQALRWYHSRRV